jgi:hypothetical protein
MEDLRSILQKIDGGQRSFRPASDSPTDIAAFQDVAKVLAFADSKGFLDGYISRQESYTGNRWYVLAMVKNGLTFPGQQYLAQPEPPAIPSQPEVLQLKPNFYGISVDLKALWRRMRGKT